jgi:hypothetical protein
MKIPKFIPNGAVSSAAAGHSPDGPSQANAIKLFQLDLRALPPT